MSHPAYTLTLPASTALPLVFDSPHSGRTYPEDFGHALTVEQLRSAEDTDVDDLYSEAPACGAPLLAANFPRAYIDPNRSVLDIDHGLFDTPWPGPVSDNPKVALGIGLIWRVLDSGEALYTRKLTHTEVMRRITQYHQPYQRALKDLLDAAHAQHGAVWHINCHSMTTVGGKASEDVGRQRADFVLGDRDGTAASREFTLLVFGFLRGLGYTVKINDPYKGVELVRAFSDPSAHRHSLQVEVNRGLYLDPSALTRSAGYPALKADITRLIHFLADYAASEARHVAATCAHHDHHHGHGHHDHHHDHRHGHDHGHSHDGHAHHSDHPHAHDHAHHHDGHAPDHEHHGHAHHHGPRQR
jgi:N-formylglutamate amidohydrolase